MAFPKGYKFSRESRKKMSLSHIGLKPNFRHGLFGTSFYETWKNMKARCNKLTNKSYKYYGKRGINCADWNVFMNFKNDMYKSYLEHIEIFGIKNTTIERIDNEKDYCVANCKWATKQEQSNNKKHGNQYKFYY